MKKNNLKPILFSTPMVQAILRGKKTQTRRLIKPQPTAENFSGFIGGYDEIPKLARFWTQREPNNPFIEDIKLKYLVGDMLWVRETWRQKGCNMPTGWGYEYKATAEEDGNPTDEPWKPSKIMPRDACRIFLKVFNVRVERLDEISEHDAIKEGIELVEHNCYKNYMQGRDWFYNHKNQNGYEMVEDPIGSFMSLWASTNGIGSLQENPWVFVYDFEVDNRYFSSFNDCSRLTHVGHTKVDVNVYNQCKNT